MLDVAVYDIQWSKIQISANLNGVAYLANGGTARSRGVEFTTLWMPVNGLRLGLNGAYTDAVSSALYDALRDDPRVSVLTAAMCQGNKLEKVRADFPLRFFVPAVCRMSS